MKTNPKTEEQMNELRMMPEGEYDFLVKEASDEISKSGNEMIKLKMNIWDAQGREHIIFDYLLAAMDFKLRHFCEATGLLRSYDDNNLEASDCVNKSGKVLIGRQEAKNGYAPKNVVTDYIVDKSTREKSQQSGGLVNSPVSDFDDKDIPF